VLMMGLTRAGAGSAAWPGRRLSCWARRRRRAYEVDHAQDVILNEECFFSLAGLSLCLLRTPSSAIIILGGASTRLGC